MRDIFGRLGFRLFALILASGALWLILSAPLYGQDQKQDLANTSWRGQDLFGSKVDYYFGADGTLIARDSRGVITGTASWILIGDKLQIEFNNGFVNQSGVLVDGRISGIGQSKTGVSGQWSLVREIGNFDSLVQLYNSRRAAPLAQSVNTAALSGNFEGMLVDQSNSYRFQLKCASEQSCVLLLPSAGRADPRMFEPVAPQLMHIGRKEALQNALNFVRNNRFERSNQNHPAYKSLAPIVDGDTRLGRCVELWQPGPPPEIVCLPEKMTHRPVWIYFAPLMNCGGDFCGAVPVPLYKRPD